MNYLAHLYLAGGDPDDLLGALLGDFLRGVAPASVPAELRPGVALHRRIDSYTDAHPAARAARRRLWPRWRHYGAVLSDVFFDHFLARDWNAWSQVPLERFTGRVYRLLEERRRDLPEPLRRAVPRIIESDLLHAYGSTPGLRAALRGLSRRSRRGVALEPAVDDLLADYPAWEADFRALFADLVALVGADLRVGPKP